MTLTPDPIPAPHSCGMPGRGALLKDLALVMFFMTILAGLLTVLMEPDFWSNVRYCQAIGISILLISRTILAVRGQANLDWRVSAVAIPLGASLGIVIGSLADGTDPLRLLEGHPNLLLSSLLLSLVFGTVISYFFYSRGAMAEAAAALHKDELERVSYEQRLVEANYKLLQAQIEPHFLFNTLSTILSLIRSEPERAERMLTDFTVCLRASLQQTRTARISLREELGLVRAYLDILAVRMGERLRYRLDVPGELLEVMLPPMLVQPLVENALKHGIEPLPEGGDITVRAGRQGNMLSLEVSDTGAGISELAPMGVGMGNVRERLELLYQGRGGLQVVMNEPRGVTVRLTIPLDGEEADE